jgi:hypothetical protein
MLREHPGDRRSDTASACLRQHPVPDLDDAPLGVEMVEHSGADDVARPGIDSSEGQQASAFGECR